MTPLKEKGWRGLKICHVVTDSIVFKQQIYCLFLQKGGEGAGGWFVDIIVVWSLILKLILIKSNIFSFGGSVTLKQAILLPNICTFRMESNFKHL